MKKNPPTKARLQELFDYDSATGNFIRKIRTGKSTHVGNIAGTIDRRDNSRQILIDGTLYRQSHIVWLWHNDAMPPKQIEQIDGDGLNCRIENLRLTFRESSETAPELTLDRLKQVIDYNPETGIFTWKVMLGKNTPPGSRAGSTLHGKHGYRHIVIDGRDYLEGRLAIFYMTGVWPAKPVRFQNKDRSDCRINNLGVGRYLTTKHDRNTKEGRASYGRAYREKYSDVIKDNELRKTFGLSLADYKEKLTAQGGVCAICGSPEISVRNGKVKMLAVDHCHDTGKIRDLLCARCNLLIGKAEDKVSLLRSAIDYLTRHRKGLD